MSTIQKLAKIEQKLESMHTDLTKNKQDIEELKRKMNMGAGGIDPNLYLRNIFVALVLLLPPPLEPRRRMP